MARNKVRLRNPNKFDGNIWLTPEQWDTFRRCGPVRYVRKTLVQKLDGYDRAICGYCGKKDLLSELQVAHRIGFSVGVIDWGLTPEWLNQETNLVFAHRKTCNTRIELSPAQVVQRLVDLGIDYTDSPAVESGLVVVTQNSDTGEYSVKYPK